MILCELRLAAVLYQFSSFVKSYLVLYYVILSSSYLIVSYLVYTNHHHVSTLSNPSSM